MSRFCIKDMLRDLHHVLGNVRLRHSLHCQQVVLGVFENQRRDRSRRCQLREVLQPQRLPMNPRRVAEPVDRDAELGEGLFEDPGVAGGALDEDGAVGDAAGEDFGARLLVCGDSGGVAQVGDEGPGLLDVEIGVHCGVKT